MNLKIRALLQRGPNDDSAKYFWRVESPFNQLRKYGIDARSIDLDDNIDEDVDILVLPKMWIPIDAREAALNLFARIRESGTIIVYDADDDIWSEGYPQHVIQTYWNEEKGLELFDQLVNVASELRANSIWTASQCDAITVSTHNLADYVRSQFDTPVYVIPNAIDVERFQSTYRKREELEDESETVTIGWAGGARPQHDLEPMLAAWNILAARADVQFVIAGWLPKLDSCQAAISKMIYHGWTDVDSYQSNMLVDIGCVSVRDTEFNARKSTIKAWEFAATGAFVVGSKALYGTEPIPYCEDTRDWVKTLEYYIEHAAARREYARQYRRHVMNQYDIRYNWVYWMDAYEKITHVVSTKRASNLVTV
jgi:hypothetical protein